MLSGGNLAESGGCSVTSSKPGSTQYSATNFRRGNRCTLLDHMAEPALGPPRPLLGWALATTIVLAALFGPPLIGQSIPALMELRHGILMIDWEFERLSIRTNATETSTLGQGDLRRAESAQSKAQVRGGVL